MLSKEPVLMNANTLYGWIEGTLRGMVYAGREATKDLSLETVVGVETPVGMQEFIVARAIQMMSVFRRMAIRDKVKTDFQEYARNLQSVVEKDTIPRVYVDWSDAVELMDQALPAFIELQGRVEYAGVLRLRLEMEMAAERRKGGEPLFIDWHRIVDMSAEEAEGTREEIERKLRGISEEFVKTLQKRGQQQAGRGSEEPGFYLR